MSRLAAPARLPFAPDSPFGIVERRHPGTFGRMMKSKSLRCLAKMIADEDASQKRPAVSPKPFVERVKGSVVPKEILELVDRVVADDMESLDEEQLARVDADVEADDEYSPEEALLRELYTSTASSEASRGEVGRPVAEGTAIVDAEEELQQLRHLLCLELRSSARGKLTDARLLKLTFDGFYRSGPCVVVDRLRIPISQRALELFSLVNKAAEARGEDTGPDTCVFSRVPEPSKPLWEVATSSSWSQRAPGTNGPIQPAVWDHSSTPNGAPVGEPPTLEPEGESLRGQAPCQPSSMPGLATDLSAPPGALPPEKVA